MFDSSKILALRFFPVFYCPRRTHDRCGGLDRHPPVSEFQARSWRMWVQVARIGGNVARPKPADSGLLQADCVGISSREYANCAALFLLVNGGPYV
jgi:hypothetical protein